MPINLEDEIVASSYDKRSYTSTYTIQRNGKRWTVKVDRRQLDAQKGRQAKRNYLGNALEQAMRGRHDNER